MQNKSSIYQALVLKTKKLGETDLLVTLITREEGKLTVVAKGARKLSSTKKAYLESGNAIAAYLIQTKSMPLLTQAKLINQNTAVRFNLIRLRRLWEFLEIIDHVIVEEELSGEIFKQILLIRELIIGGHPNTIIKKELCSLLYKLSIGTDESSLNQNLTSQVSEFTGKKMLAFEYLKLDSQF